MNTPILFLSSAGSLRPYFVENPLWQTVEEVLENTFAAGGSVELSQGQKVYEPREGLRIFESICMVASPGEFRIQVLLGIQEKGRSLREWWEPGDTPFRGGKWVDDDQFDLRTFCSDIAIAKNLFGEFFDHMGICDVLMQSTYSVSDRGSWIKPGSRG